MPGFFGWCWPTSKAAPTRSPRSTSPNSRRAGLPPPIRQTIRCDHSGRRRFLDADFGTFSVEIDGGFHIKPLNYWDDARRQNDLLLIGQRILRFPSVALRLEPEIVVAQLRAAKALFG